KRALFFLSFLIASLSLVSVALNFSLKECSISRKCSFSILFLRSGECPNLGQQ
ncbi:hypothetical protein TorRG33x02_309830, partial [Trema orientale]